MLAQVGYITESAVVLRTVADFCTEISVIGFTLHQGGDLPAVVEEFVAQYFMARARTPEELATLKPRYVSREALMKIHRQNQIDSNQTERLHRFLNYTLDAYVHGSSDTTMDLWNPHKNSFRDARTPTRRET